MSADRTPEALAGDGGIYENEPAIALRFTPLEAFAAADEPGAEPLASSPDGGVALAAGSDTLVYGDGGAGKTTLVTDLCFKLAAGDSWVGIVEPARPLRIAFVENEGPRPMLRRKLAAKLAATGATLDDRIVVLEEPWGELTFADEQHRAALAVAATDLELDLLVIGPLVSAGEFPNGGTPAEVAQFERLTKDLRRQVERPLAIVLIHHENKSGQISGAWARFGDTHLQVTAQGNGRTRIVWDKARWASTLHKTSMSLVWAAGETYIAEEKPELTEDTMREAIESAVRANPGGSWSKIRDTRNSDGNKIVRGNLTDLQRIRDSLLTRGTLVNGTAVEGRFELYLADGPQGTRSDPGTTLERPTFPPPASEGAPIRSAVPAYRGNGYGNGTDSSEPEHPQADLTLIDGAEA